MDWIQVKIKSNKLREEYKKRFNIKKIESSEKLNILKSFIDLHVELDFFYKFDPAETKSKEQFECVCYYDNGKSIYQVIIPYEIAHDEYYQDNNLIGVHDLNNNCFSLEDDNLIINNKNYNPNRIMVKQTIESYIQSETEDYRSEPDYDSMKGGRDYKNDLKNMES